MPSEINSNAFCADYSSISNCLFAVQTSEAEGLFNGDDTLLQLLSLFEKDPLRRLYNRTLRVLAIINQVDGITSPGLNGDFNGLDFSGKAFNIPELLGGDFYEQDFYDADFYVGYLDTTNNSYSSAFQTVLNIFTEFCYRSNEISAVDIAALNSALVAVLDAFTEIQEYLAGKGLNPCEVTSVTYFNNSPSVYLQAAGSDGTNGIAEGIHLRWSLNGEMGNNHLPKGNYSAAENSVGFNKPNDFVYIYRTAYTNEARFTIDFQNDRPTINNNTKKWVYLLNLNIDGVKLSNQVLLSFTDPALYDQQAASLSPAENYFQFLKQYPGIIEISVLKKTLFATTFEFHNTSVSETAYLKIEAACGISGPEISETVTVRKTARLEPANTITASLSAENIQVIRIKKTANSFLQKFSFESYHDFLKTKTDADWSSVGNGFGLSLDDQQVFARLESPEYIIDNLWPQFNNGTKVRVSNYQDKWITSRPNEPSVKALVTEYLSLSETDPRAQDVVKEDNSGPEDPGLLISYLDVLNLLSTDYHLARMLGLGHIDKPVAVSSGDSFVYKLTYNNRRTAGAAEITVYDYVCLPTSKQDSLLPPVPHIRPLTYGLPNPKAAANNIFDEDGYTHIDNIRAINIGRELYPDELPDHDFFANLMADENSNLFKYPKPILYGIEHRRSDESSYLKPEITQDKTIGTVYHAYDDSNPKGGIPETVPVPDDPDSLFVHFNRRTGILIYAIYSINWFSRASLLSAEVSSDATIFPLKNNLAPPTDVAIQYIQKEDTLIFTTAMEQGWLTSRSLAFPGQDTGFSRITFNWQDLLDISYLQNPSAAELSEIVKPDKIKGYFKPDLIREVTGILIHVKEVPGTDNQLDLTTGPYTTIDGTMISPYIDINNFRNFADSLLNTTNGQYRVISIFAGNPWPVIRIEKIAEVITVPDEESPGIYATQKLLYAPEVNSRFSMVENLSNPGNWNSVAEEINLFSFADPENPHIESSLDSEGNVSQVWVGGIHGEALVTALYGNPVSSSNMPGYYKIEFDAGVQLPAHPQINLPFDPSQPDQNNPSALAGAHVEWYKGILRIPLSGDLSEKKKIEVVRIAQNNPLVLYAFDPDYQDAPVVSTTIPTQTYQLNFHPGYRAYLFPEPSPAHSFNGANILPAATENDRKTLFGLQSADTKPGGSGFSSRVSVPVVILARTIVEPVLFDAPIAANYRVRPDQTARAAFTFDVKIPTSVNGTARLPFGFRFYRTNHLDVLEELYESTTVAQILEDLKTLTEDLNYNQRFFELVNLIFDPGNEGHFRIFAATPNAYGFPVPDKAGLTMQDDTDTVKKEKYKSAITASFLPLTEQPPIFSFLKTGMQTENVQPQIRDIDGNLLDATYAIFNPFPMVRKYTKSGEPDFTYIRFTDYTLNGASRYLYFYAGAEINNQLVPGPVSPFTGPVTILQTMPSDAPSIRSYHMDLATGNADVPVSLTFDIAPMAENDHHTALRIYRTADQSKTLSLSLMESFTEFEIAENSPGGYQLTDDLSDINPLPIGAILYFRIAAVRTIINEDNLPEHVLSYGSEVVAIRLIDTVNPQAPELTYNAQTNRLSWVATTNAGTYYIFKQNSRGNWEKLTSVINGYKGTLLSYQLPAPLIVMDDDGDRVYNRFKIKVENSSGLVNLTDKELTV